MRVAPAGTFRRDDKKAAGRKLLFSLCTVSKRSGRQVKPDIQKKKQMGASHEIVEKSFDHAVAFLGGWKGKKKRPEAAPLLLYTNQ
ncbi:MAG: hypothetical protein N3D11_13285, partial [Candidatus Sumerlaeia bacterium]|nr:hypothetical protein [Candidatus Sumerlaeia bacterium]